MAPSSMAPDVDAPFGDDNFKTPFHAAGFPPRAVKLEPATHSSDTYIGV